jgi:1-acyl-sn-glycerol-3-phosphate acyltransferase
VSPAEQGAEYRYANRGLRQRILYDACRYIALWFLWICFGFRRYRLDRLPKRGAYLLVANHQSYLDPPILGICVRGRQFVPLARIGLFDWKYVGPLIAKVNSIPIDQSKGDTGAMRKALKALDQGHPVGIFPEGARTPDGKIHEFKRGAALLLRRSKCPVVPVAIDGAFEAWSRFDKRPKVFRHKVAVLIGDPIEHDDLGENPVETIEQAVRELHAELRRKMGKPPLEASDTPAADEG